MFSRKSWLVRSILIPFLITRALLVFVGVVSKYVLPIDSLQSGAVLSNGWLFSSHRLIDIWSRWDSGWYLSIIKIGYSMGQDVYSTSNLAFFPVFPYMVKFLSFFVPVRPLTDEIIILVGLILSNLMLVGSLILLYKITLHLFNKEKIARSVVWYLLVFPSSFFLSSFYTESTFLFFSLLSYWALIKKKLWLACVMAAIVSATRSIGIFIALPIFLEYLRSKNYSLKKINLSVLWFAVIPLGTFLFFLYMQNLTGDFFAAIKVQNAWGRKVADPVSSLFFPSGFWLYLTPIDQFFMVSSLIISLAMIKDKFKELKPLGFYSILLIIPGLFTGTLDSSVRYLIIVFPIFIYWAYLTSNDESDNLGRKAVHKVRTALLGRFGGFVQKPMGEIFGETTKFGVGLKLLLMTLQIILFALFSQFYWVG